jgi:4,5-DOPA dioxygenase extradiol
MLLDDELWTSQLEKVASSIEKPKAILIVSAHWESAPVTLSSPVAGTPLSMTSADLIANFLK